jgi:putative ABC transport system ATP-binding protein
MFALGRKHGTTLVLVTHDERLADRCERVVRMADGRIVSDGAGKPAAPPEMSEGSSSPVGARA